jgi:hypothetical protein
MRSQLSTFRSELKAFLERLLAPPPPGDHWKGRLAQEVLARWIDHPECEAIWVTLQSSLKVAVTPGHFISEIIFARFDAEQLSIIVSEARTIEAKARVRTKRHLIEKNYEQIAHENALLADFLERRSRVIGRKKSGPRVHFMRQISAAFVQWCDAPLDNVARVLTEIAFGEPITIEAVRAARNPRATSDRGIRLPK